MLFYINFAESLGLCFKTTTFGVFIFVGSLILNFFARHFFIKLNLLDSPDGGLKTHQIPVPYSGGAAIVLAHAVGCFFASYFFYTSINFSFILYLLPFFILGLIDDIFCVSQKIKFAVQLVLLFCVLYGLQLKVGPVEVIWMLAVINAFNLIDVADGLCGTISLVVAANFSLIAIILGQCNLAMLFGVLALAVAGFLFFNLPPARCYLGDAGSTFLGANFAIAPWLISWPSTSIKLLSSTVILGLALAEVVALVIIRSHLGLAPYRGSPHHFVHFLQAKKWSKTKVIGFVFLTNLLLGILGTGLVWQAVSLSLLLSLLPVAFCLWLLVVYF